MHARRYMLRLPPKEAIRAFEASEHLDALIEGRIVAMGGRVIGSVSGSAAAIALEAKRIEEGFAFSTPLTARVEVELEATEHGSAFSLRRIPPRFTRTVEFRGALIVAVLTVLAMLQLGLVPLMLYVCITTAQLLVAGVYWLVHRRGVAAVNDALINLVWRVWAPALQDESAGMYRGPAALTP